MPADSDVQAALAEIADHPEITLSRREILRFILIEPTKRSEEIQAILKLEDIGETRAALNTAQHRLLTAQRAAAAQVESTRDSLLRHLQISAMRADDLLAAVNQRRKLLGVRELAELTPDTRVDLGLSAAASGPDFNKQSALRDLGNLSEAAQGFPDLAKADAAGILVDLTNVEQWAVNKAVHYNEWANFGRKDFQPVVAAFKDLLACFRCESCDSWIYVTPRVNPESVRCDCNAIGLNLKPKPK